MTEPNVADQRVGSSTLSPKKIPLWLVREGPLELRNFFAAASLAGLSVAGQSLAAGFVLVPGASAVRGLTMPDWQEAEYAFNRLFVGPQPPVAPPYASVYLDREPQLMGASTMQVREFYLSMGLAVPAQGSMPDDHIAFELDSWRSLCALCRQPLEPEVKQSVLAAKRWLIRDHMGAWVPLFVRRVLSAPDPCLPVQFAASCLDHWLHEISEVCCSMDAKRTCPLSDLPLSTVLES